MHQDELSRDQVDWLRSLIDAYRHLRAESGIPEPDTDAAAEMLSNCEMLADELEAALAVPDPIIRATG